MRIKGQSGQFVIEYVLLLTVTIAVFAAVTQQLKTNLTLSKLVSDPWEKVAGMAESGSWNPPADARTKHPNNFDRFYTPKEN
jgi:hypothetical protein